VSHYLLSPDSLKAQQKEIIQCILAVIMAVINNMIAVLPTGYGRSILYMLPPLLLDEVRMSVHIPYTLVTRKQKDTLTQKLVRTFANSEINGKPTFRSKGHR